jgi:hypothetical protein
MCCGALPRRDSFSELSTDWCSLGYIALFLVDALAIVRPLAPCRISMVLALERTLERNKPLCADHRNTTSSTISPEDHPIRPR